MSAIDPTKPTTTTATTQSVRDNFQAAASEIDALEASKAPASVLAAHLADSANPHEVTAAQAGADPAGSADDVATAVAAGIEQIKPLADAPATPAEGQVYYDTTLHKFRGADDAGWKNLPLGAVLFFLTTLIATDAITDPHFEPLPANSLSAGIPTSSLQATTP